MSIYQKETYWDYDLLHLDRSLTAVAPEHCDGKPAADDKTCNTEYQYELQLCSAGEDSPRNPECAGDGVWGGGCVVRVFLVVLRACVCVCGLHGSPHRILEAPNVPNGIGKHP